MKDVNAPTTEKTMNPGTSEILDRLINAQRAVGGTMRWKDRNVEDAYVLRAVGGRRLLITWKGTQYHVHSLTGILSIETPAYLASVDTLKELNKVVTEFFAPQLKVANGVGCRKH